MKYDELCVAAIRSLCLDITNNAKSGHPGMALSSAPILYALYTRHLISDPSHPNWINRDRFILSAGHCSALLYSILHLSGFNVSKDDLKAFRKLGSKTPGHPEYGKTSGVDNTSGPLGQGLSQAVGVALAESILAHSYPEGSKLFNHYTYCLVGDGCLEEGISEESISFAGKNKLNKLIVLYDRNNVTLDGPLSYSSSADQIARFQANNWDTIHVTDGNNVEAISQAIELAKASQEKPTLIVVDTVIGYGTPKQGTSKVHGAPVGLEDAEIAKKFYGYDYAPFEIPDEVYMVFRSTFAARGEKLYSRYLDTFKEYKEKYPEEANYLIEVSENDVSQLINLDTDSCPAEQKEATRISSGHILNIFAKKIKNLVGGSADVASSTKAHIEGEEDYSPTNKAGRNIRFGIREFAMAGIQNGILLHKGLRTFASTFLVFSDYLKPAIRMAAMSHLPAIFVFTHDSIALGEDGETHQPIEHLAMLRSIPNCNTIRPCDARETYAAWKLALEETSKPTCIILTRQGVQQVPNTTYSGVKNGGYIVSKEREKLDFTLIASGSEVNLALDAQKLLLADGVDTRVVSMPSLNAFDNLNRDEQEEVLGNDASKCIFVEMLSSYGLYKYASHTFALDTYGDSGKGEEVVEHFGFTPSNLAKRVEDILKEDSNND